MINWKKQYNTGVKKIDNQHMKLLQLLNIMNGSDIIRYNEEKINVVIQDLIDYTNYHFTTEEDIMIKYDYPGYEKHRKEHVTFVKSIGDHINRSRNIGIVLISSLSTYIGEWIIDHLLGTDQEFAEYLRSVDAVETHES